MDHGLVSRFATTYISWGVSLKRNVIVSGVARGSLVGTIIGLFSALLLDLCAYIQVGRIDLHNFALFAIGAIVSCIWAGAWIGLFVGIVKAVLMRQ